MSIKRIGTADNREEWLEQRKGYLTASAIAGWRGPDHLPSKYAWYFEDNNRESILAEKFDGLQKLFGSYAEVSMAHGRDDEEHIIGKVGKELGSHTEPDNSMFVNDRWPHIAATIDAFIYVPTEDGEFCYGQDPSQNSKAQEALITLVDHDLDATVLETKKSVSVGWAKGEVPPYYVTQVQTQIAVLDLPFGLIAAECLFKHPKEKWRLFWDLRISVIERDPSWGAVLDQCNEEFAKELDLAQSL